MIATGLKNILHNYARFFTLEGLNFVLLYYAYLREIYSKFMSVHLIQYSHASDCCFVCVNYYLMVYMIIGHCIIIFSFESFAFCHLVICVDFASELKNSM